MALGSSLAVSPRCPCSWPLILLLLWGQASCSRRSVPQGALTFVREGSQRTLSLAALSEQAPLRRVQTWDPYYQKTKRFRALPAAPVLAFAYGLSHQALREQAFVMRALDGYAVPISGARLLDDHAFIAIDDLEVPGFAPIGPRQVSPAPAYVIWQGHKHNDLESHPRPWQLTTIEMVDLTRVYPHAVPRAAPTGGLAMEGYALFRQRCIRCHAINREGGRVGPDLNVPQSIVNYRPEAQIRAYIKDPRSFRYGAMPPNPDLTDHQLDALLAYFRAMAAEPHDPNPDR